MEAIITLMGPVGPVICVGVPPNRDAKKLVKMAPYKQASAPMLAYVGPSGANATIPKARARGNAMIEEDIPPKRSPFQFQKIFLNITGFLICCDQVFAVSERCRFCFQINMPNRLGQ
jgi:hypothetical protein